jgi:hypothetical protein
MFWTFRTATTKPTPSGVRTPTGIDDMVAWFDGNYGIYTDGSEITRWVSKTNNGVWVSASVAQKSPQLNESVLNGNNVLNFPGTGYFLTNDTPNGPLATLMTGSAQCTMCFVAKSTATGGNDTLFGWGPKNGDNDGDDVSYNTTNGIVGSTNNVASAKSIGANRPAIGGDDEFHVVTVIMRHDAGEYLIKVDGMLVGSVDQAALDQDSFIDYFQIGRRPRTSSEWFIGQLAELMIYDRVLTSEEIVKVEEYLFDKYFNPETFANVFEWFKPGEGVQV